MPAWIVTVAGWMALIVGGLSLLSGTRFVRDRNARDSTGTPGWAVLASSTALVLLGVHLLTGRWLPLIVPIGILLTAGEMGRIRARRRHRPPARRPARTHHGEPADPRSDFLPVSPRCRKVS